MDIETRPYWFQPHLDDSRHGSFFPCSLSYVHTYTIVTIRELFVLRRIEFSHSVRCRGFAVAQYHTTKEPFNGLSLNELRNDDMNTLRISMDARLRS